MYRICGRPFREQRHSTFSRSGREKRSIKTHHPLWNGYTLRPLTQRSTSADTLPIALISFLVHLRKHRASFNVGADLLSLSAGLECRTRTYNFLLVRETRFHCVNSRYVTRDGNTGVSKDTEINNRVVEDTGIEPVTSSLQG